MKQRRPGEPFPLSSPFVDQQQMLLISQIHSFYWRVMKTQGVTPFYRKDDTGSVAWTMFPDVTEGQVMVSYGLPWHKDKSQGFHQDSFEVPLIKVLMGREEDIQSLAKYLRGENDEET